MLAEGLSGTRPGIWHTLTLIVKVKKILFKRRETRMDNIKSELFFFYYLMQCVCFNRVIMLSEC